MKVTRHGGVTIEITEGIGDSTWTGNVDCTNTRVKQMFKKHAQGNAHHYKQYASKQLLYSPDNVHNELQTYLEESQDHR